MTIWQPDITQFTGPRYRALAEAIAVAIENGELAAGIKLPPMRELAWKLGVTIGTVNRGYTLAMEQGLVRGEVGRGTYVRSVDMVPPDLADEPIDLDAAVLNLKRSVPAGTRASTYLARSLREITAMVEHDLPATREILNYGDPGGALNFRQTGAKWLARVGLDVPAGRVIVTGGAQQALAAILGTVVGVGECILVESLTYIGIQQNASLRGLRLAGLAMDEEGILPEALEAACLKETVRLLCVVPTLQNPTTATMSLERRQAIVALARKYDLLILEDDVYGFLPPDRPLPIAVLAPERTIYVTSASKCLAPGLRVGWMVAPEAYVEPLIDTLYALSLALPALPLQIVSRWIETGAADELLALQRAECVTRQKLAIDIFSGLQFRTDPYCLHLLLDLPAPWRASDFVMAAALQGITVRPASHFSIGQAAAPQAIRISVGAARSTARLETALKALADLARSTPSTRRSVI